MSQPTVVPVGASTPTVVTCGADMFADSVAGQAVDVERVDWRPPMPGTEADLADGRHRSPPPRRQPSRGRGDARRHGPPRRRRARLRGARPREGPVPPRGPADRVGADVRPPARRADGRRRPRGPRRRPRGRRRALRVRQLRQPRAVPPPQRRRPDGRRRDAVHVDVGPRGPRDRAPDVLLPQRGPRQGAAIRRLRPGGAHPAALDGRRARPSAAGRRARHRARRPTSPGSSRRCCRWATRRTTATAPAR